MARRRLAARNLRPPLPALRLLARGVQQPAAVGASVLRGTADTLLDAASYGSCCMLLSPAPAVGPSAPGAGSNSKFEFESVAHHSCPQRPGPGVDRVGRVAGGPYTGGGGFGGGLPGGGRGTNGGGPGTGRTGGSGPGGGGAGCPVETGQRAQPVVTRVGRGAREPLISAAHSAPPGEISAPRPAPPGAPGLARADRAWPGSRSPGHPADLLCPGLARGLGWHALDSRAGAAHTASRACARGRARCACAYTRAAPERDAVRVLYLRPGCCCAQAPTFAFFCARTALPTIWAKARDELHPVQEFRMINPM